MLFFTQRKALLALALVSLPYLTSSHPTENPSDLSLHCTTGDVDCFNGIIPSPDGEKPVILEARGGKAKVGKPPAKNPPAGSPPNKNPPAKDPPASQTGKPAGNDPLGTGQGVGTIESMDSYLAKGEKRIKNLQSAIERKSQDTEIKPINEMPEKDKTNFYTIFADMFTLVDNYVIEPEPGQKVSKYPEVVSLVKTADVGFEINERSPITEYTVRASGTKGDIINAGAYSMDGTFIIANIAFKDNDKTPKQSKNHVPNNEMTWQAFAKVAKKKANKLQGMILRDIQNKGTWEILRQGYASRNIPLTQHATWELESKDPETVKWFKRLVGCDNIGGKLLTMANHHNAIGSKQIKKITTYPRQIGPDTKGKLTMVLTLG
ncbi:hypothetical protein N8T08_002219 [Aspergillus melleus]|uniref:Uncharacterized protein n=1 Tax=Aspergillus melleus TaxID=138277 RepID=A0ACC3B928_9EURO|nr:hypothetical protein N8T08_002219 [Aspergillus melleus]